MDRLRVAFRLCALTTAIFAAASALAQGLPREPADIDYTEFNLEQLVAMDVVYGASSYDQKITDAPAAVTVITADEIQTHHYHTLADVLASARGFHITYDRSYDYVGVRGFGRPGDFNTRVLILVDGHTANDIIYGTGPIGAELAADLALVKRIEIIRGPVSALYGAGAFFAVVNLVTYDGDELGGGEVAFEYGSRRRLGGMAVWGGNAGRDGTLLLSASGFSDDGDDFYWSEYDDPLTNNGLFVDGDREAVGHLYGKYRFGGLQATAAWTRRDKRNPTGDWEMIFNDTAAQVGDERLALDLSGTRAVSESMSLRARLSYDDYWCRGDYPFEVAESGQPTMRVVQHDTAHGRWWSGELQSAVVRGEHRLVAGADTRRAIIASQTSVLTDPFEELIAVDSSLDNWGIYLQDEWTLDVRASLYMGLRYDSYRSFGGNLTPRCALVTHPGRRTTAKLLYGEAFRAPNAYELDYGDGLSSKGSPDLEPENVRTWEAVVERALGNSVQAGLSVFDNTIAGLIEQVVDTTDDLLIFRNLGDARTRGVELDLDARLLPGLRGRLSFSAQRAEDIATGAALSNAPEQLFKLNLSTPRQGRLVAGGLELQYVSDRLAPDGAVVPAYAVVNLDLTWWTPLSGLQADLSIRNALDEQYGDPAAVHHRQNTLAREGRLLNARLGWRW